MGMKTVEMMEDHAIINHVSMHAALSKRCQTDPKLLRAWHPKQAQSLLTTGLNLIVVFS